MKGLLLLIFLLGFTQSAEALLTSNLAQNDKSVPAFVYHRFGDDRYPSTNISIENFEAHLQYLQREGYKTLTFKESIDYLKSGKKPEKVVCLTIDDGYKSFVENGLPLLIKYGFKATLFVNTETIGSSDYMDWDDLKQAADAGIEIGNHSHSHDYFLNDSTASGLESYAADLMKSQSLIEQNLGFRPQTFAYPYGEFDDSLKRVTKEAGFIAAAAQSSGVMHSEMDVFQCPRFPMSDRYAKIGSFIEKVTMLPLKVTAVETVSKGYYGSPTSPRVIFRFDQTGLNIQAIQCFAQGERCSKSVRINRDGNVQLTVKSQVELTSRRTLFTITIPDDQGRWHWYSYTWVNTAILE